MTRITPIMFAAAVALFFAGCGQSGPLYIPGNPSQMAVPPSQPEESETQPEEETDPPPAP